jgi:disulfide bond formation protein DsbB
MSSRNRQSLAVGAGTSVALVATAGSLWFSLGLGLWPCRLCWYQRILMYPQVVLFGAAFLRDRADVYWTSLPLSVAGLAAAVYHSWLQATTSTCALGGGCATVQWRLPVVGATIPTLSALAFALLLVVGGVLVRSQ